MILLEGRNLLLSIFIDIIFYLIYDIYVHTVWNRFRLVIGHIKWCKIIWLLKFLKYYFWKRNFYKCYVTSFYDYIFIRQNKHQKKHVYKMFIVKLRDWHISFDMKSKFVLLFEFKSCFRVKLNILSAWIYKNKIKMHDS